MKIGIFGDIHITDHRPENRKDSDFLHTVLGKVEQGLHLLEGADVIVMPGDIFDSHKVSDFIKQEVIPLFRSADVPILAVFGQHDLRYHSSDKLNTPLAVMEAADVLRVLRFMEPVTIKDHTFYGSNWGEDIPEFPDSNLYSILVTHRMILGDEKLWDGQTDYTLSRSIMFKYKYDLVISGDNHQQFVYQRGDKILVNAGSLTRTKINQKDHFPAVYMYEREWNDPPKLTRLPIVCAPWEQIFEVEKAEKEKEKNEELQSFILEIKERMSTGDISSRGVNFKENLRDYIEKHPLTEGQSKILERILK